MTFSPILPLTLLAASLLAADSAPVPIALHPDNPHYFLWRGKPTILITSGEHYGAVLNLDFDYAAYLRALQADGLNHTRTFSGAYREIPSSFGITDNPLAPKPNRYACPWARSETPGYFDAGKAYAAYVHVPLPKKPKDEELRRHAAKTVTAELVLDLPAGRYRAEWWNTKTGEVTPSAAFTHSGGEKILNSPPFSEDVALRLVAAP